jgi:hypothetical protein
MGNSDFIIHINRSGQRRLTHLTDNLFTQQPTPVFYERLRWRGVYRNMDNPGTYALDLNNDGVICGLRQITSNNYRYDFDEFIVTSEDQAYSVASECRPEKWNKIGYIASGQYLVTMLDEDHPISSVSDFASALGFSLLLDSVMNPDIGVHVFFSEPPR